MKRNGSLPELLSPVGGEEALVAAIAGGADAVYLGGTLFNARAYAKNLDSDALSRAISLAHAHGVKVYVTMNTLLWDLELEEAIAYAFSLYEKGVDALIVADMGLASILKERIADFPIHASTQMSLHSTDGVKEVSDLGITCAVLARELSREDIASAVEGAPCHIEMFLHGALCVCHSGQCLFSSLVGGRSGNRGTCAQPCRLPYNGGYPISLSDLSLASHVEDLIRLGVSSLKIEGRMKSAEYVYLVTSIYRRLLDEGRNATPEEMARLASIFSRGGFTDGYYTDRHTMPMTGVRSEADKAESRSLTVTIPPLAKVPLTATVSIHKDQPCRLTLTRGDGKCVTVEGDVPSPAINAPLTKDGVLDRLAKLGATPYILDIQASEVTLDEGLNLSPASINALRRRAIALLDGVREVSAPCDYRRPRRVYQSEGMTALFEEPMVYEALGKDREAFTLAFLPLWRISECVHTPKGVWLPPVVTDRESQEVKKMLVDAVARGVTHALCGNAGGVRLAREAGLSIVGDFRLNITNTASATYWQSHGVEDAILSPELTAPAARDIGGRVIAYGRIPLMLTERCFMRDMGSCDGCNNRTLTDRKGVSFPIRRIYPHRNEILNSIPTYLGDLKEGLPTGIKPHFLFTTESVREVKEVISAYQSGKSLPYPVRRMPKERV